MSKLHFLFIMLNISQVNVIKKGIITGIITKLEFVKKRKEEKKIKRKELIFQRKMNGMTGGGGILGSDANLRTPRGDEVLGLLDRPQLSSAAPFTINQHVIDNSLPIATLDQQQQQQ